MTTHQHYDKDAGSSFIHDHPVHGGRHLHGARASEHTHYDHWLLEQRVSDLEAFVEGLKAYVTDE